MDHLKAKLGEFLGEDVLTESKESKQAADFLMKNILPDGSRLSRKIEPIVGFDGDIVIQSVKRKKIGDSTVFTFDMLLKPGPGGGGGVGVSPASSNQYFNMSGTDKKSVKGMQAAFDKFVKSSRKDIGKQMHRWLKDPGNWVWRIVGWGQRNSWGKPSVKILKVKPSGTMIDPTRRKWPSGRTEVWSPVTVTIQAEMKPNVRKAQMESKMSRRDAHKGMLSFAKTHEGIIRKEMSRVMKSKGISNPEDIGIKSQSDYNKLIADVYSHANAVQDRHADIKKYYDDDYKGTLAIAASEVVKDRISGKRKER